MLYGVYVYGILHTRYVAWSYNTIYAYTTMLVFRCIDGHLLDLPRIARSKDNIGRLPRTYIIRCNGHGPDLCFLILFCLQGPTRNKKKKKKEIVAIVSGIEIQRLRVFSPEIHLGLGEAVFVCFCLLSYTCVCLCMLLDICFACYSV